jgi:hypothetical protein
VEDFDMKRTVAAVLLAVVALAGLTRLVRAQEKEEPVDPRILAYDKGPAKIDVSTYPPAMQNIYKTLFLKKCSECHTVARAINSDYVLEDEWERYVKRMMRRSGKITPDEGKQIFDFLVYDSKTRKKAMYDKRLAEGPKP